MVGSEANVGIGCQVKDHLASGHGGTESIQVEEIGAHQPIAPIRLRAGDKLLLARGEVVESNHFMAVRKQPVDQSTSNEAGRAGYKRSQ